LHALASPKSLHTLVVDLPAIPAKKSTDHSVSKSRMLAGQLLHAFDQLHFVIG
jgi:hypothetical protein